MFIFFLQFTNKHHSTASYLSINLKLLYNQCLREMPSVPLKLVLGEILLLVCTALYVPAESGTLSLTFIWQALEILGKALNTWYHFYQFKLTMAALSSKLFPQTKILLRVAFIFMASDSAHKPLPQMLFVLISNLQK